MTSEQFPQMVAVFFIGLGLLLAGGANLILREKSLFARLPVTALVVALMLGGVWALSESYSHVQFTGLVLGGVLAVGMLAGSDHLASVASLLSVVFRRPALRWGLVACAGITIAVGSALVSELEFDRELDRQMAELENLTAPPPTISPSAVATTDRGQPVEIREVTSFRTDADLESIETTLMQNPTIRASVIRSEPATDRSNCHGWVFTGGKYWIAGAEVDRILADNAYKVIVDPQPGDLVVYRSGANVLHTGVVRYTAESQPAIVEGKWGCTGVFLHPVGKSIYGSSYTYYRSTRAGHVLAGLNATGLPNAQFTPTNPDEFTE